MMKPINIFTSLLMIPFVLTACVVGPDFHRPEPPKQKSFTSDGMKSVDLKLADSLDAFTFHQQASIPSQWWQLFKSDALNKLVVLGLKQSPTIEAAKFRLQASQQNLEADVGSVLYPQLNAQITSNRKKINGITFGQSNFSKIYDLQSASLNASYNIDFFGGSRRFVESSQANVDSLRYELAAAKMTLAANIVSSAINEASIRGQISVLNETIVLQQKSLELIKKQYSYGAIPRINVLQQASLLAQTQTQLPVLEKALSVSRHQLTALIGEFPDATLASFELSHLTLPHQLPIILPSELTKQRPDILSAEASLHQASALIGVATASLYPSLSLSASYGPQTSKFSDLFRSGAGVWGIAAGLVQPIFNGGELREKKKAAESTYQQTAAQYRQVVISAFQDVANALSALQFDVRKEKLELQAQGLTHDSFMLIQDQFNKGAASYLELLTAQIQYQQTRMSAIQAKAVLYSDSAGLMYALGGGWWQPNQVDTPSNQQNMKLNDLKVENSL